MILRSLVVVGILAVAGCASTPMTDAPIDLAFRPIVDRFDLSGRLAARNGDQAISGKFDWRHAPGQDRWDFYSPMGQIVARVRRDEQLATLVTAQGEQIIEPFDRLMQRVLGMSVPVGALSRWVQAGVVTGEDVRARDGRGRPVRIVDNGWLVRYLSYASDAPDAAPRTIELSRGEASLRLVIDRWQ